MHTFNPEIVNICVNHYSICRAHLEGGRTVEHVRGVRDGGDVPGREGSIEGGGVLEHGGDDSNRGDVPGGQVLVKGGGHVGDSGQVPIKEVSVEQDDLVFFLGGVGKPAVHDVVEGVILQDTPPIAPSLPTNI